MKIKSREAAHSLFAGFDPTTGQINQDSARRAVMEAEEEAKIRAFDTFDYICREFLLRFYHTSPDGVKALIKEFETYYDK